MANWKTSLCGVLAAIAAYCVGHPADFPAWAVTVANVVAPLATSLGLVFARDAKAEASNGRP